MASLQSFHRRLTTTGAENLSEKVVLWLLLPLSVLFGSIAWLRGKCYDLKLFRVYRPEVPVVSVGNLAVGGTGKTPVVDWLLKQFIRQGKRPAVVSRGYGGSYSGAVGVVAKGDGPLLTAAQAGDEPFLLARRNPQALILIAKKRALGVRAAVEQFAADVVILDDGFQHRAVARDVDLLLLDGRRPFGNGLPLPAGLLREYPGALQRADLVLLTRSEEDTVRPAIEKPCWRSQHRLAEVAIPLEGEAVALEELTSLRFLAFAGIAEPGSFFASLAEQGINLTAKLAFSDHQCYDSAALARLNAYAGAVDAYITTEKDAVKLAPEDLSRPCFAVPMDIKIENEGAFLIELNRLLEKKIDGDKT